MGTQKCSIMGRTGGSGLSVKKSALSTTVAVILTAIIVGSVVGGAGSSTPQMPPMRG